MNRVLQTAGLSFVLMGLVASSAANAQSREETAQACQDAAVLLQENDIDGALDEARWCVEGLEQLKRNATLEALPDEVLSFAGGEVSNQSALGMTMLERVYESDADSVTVSLTTGAASGGLAALAQMGLSLGASGGKKMRIQKRTVFDMTEPGGDAQFLVQLKSGGMLNISSSNVSRDGLLAFVEAFPIIAIDEALEE